MTFKVKESMHFVKQKNKLLKKTKRNRKWKIPRTVLERLTLYFNSCKNRTIKLWRVKLWWVGAREREKRKFFVPFILSEGNFLKHFCLSQCIVHWMDFQNMYTFLCGKNYFMHFCLFLKSSKAFMYP